MAPIQTRRSRKLREATYIDGQHNSIMKEISMPNKNGTIPLLNFLENTTKFMDDTRQLHMRMTHLEQKTEEHKKLQIKYDKLVQYLEQVTDTINKHKHTLKELEEIPTLETFKEDMEEDEKEAGEENKEDSNNGEDSEKRGELKDIRPMVEEIPNYFESIKKNNELSFANKNKTQKLPAPLILQEPRKKGPSSPWDLLSSHGEINTLLEEDLQKMENLSNNIKK